MSFKTFGLIIFWAMTACIAVQAFAMTFRVGLLAYGWFETGQFLDLPHTRELPTDLVFMGVFYLLWKEVRI
jgi:hypothetical protein